MVNFITNFGAGKGTYVTGWLAIIAGVVDVVLPGILPMEIGDPGQMIVTGLGIVFLRRGMKST